jgi:hypothetical protein
LVQDRNLTSAVSPTSAPVIKCKAALGVALAGGRVSKVTHFEVDDTDITRMLNRDALITECMQSGIPPGHQRVIVRNCEIAVPQDP